MFVCVWGGELHPVFDFCVCPHAAVGDDGGSMPFANLFLPFIFKLCSLEKKLFGGFRRISETVTFFVRFLFLKFLTLIFFIIFLT